MGIKREEPPILHSRSVPIAGIGPARQQASSSQGACDEQCDPTILYLMVCGRDSLALSQSGPCLRPPTRKLPASPEAD